MKKILLAVFLIAACNPLMNEENLDPAMKDDPPKDTLPDMSFMSDEELPFGLDVYEFAIAECPDTEYDTQRSKIIYHRLNLALTNNSDTDILEDVQFYVPNQDLDYFKSLPDDSTQAFIKTQAEYYGFLDGGCPNTFAGGAVIATNYAFKEKGKELHFFMDWRWDKDSDFPDISFMSETEQPYGVNLIKAVWQDCTYSSYVTDRSGTIYNRIASSLSDSTNTDNLEDIKVTVFDEDLNHWQDNDSIIQAAFRGEEEYKGILDNGCPRKFASGALIKPNWRFGDDDMFHYFIDWDWWN